MGLLVWDLDVQQISKGEGRREKGEALAEG